MEVGSSFFEVAKPLDHDTFLSVCDDVLRDSLLLLAPFGLPRSALLVVLVYRRRLHCSLLLLRVVNDLPGLPVVSKPECMSSAG